LKRNGIQIGGEDIEYEVEKKKLEDDTISCLFIWEWVT